MVVSSRGGTYFFAFGAAVVFIGLCDMALWAIDPNSFI
jgi:hypothetical protein